MNPPHVADVEFFMSKMEPVWVWEGAAKLRELNSVREANLFLLYRWPVAERTSSAYLAARKAGLSALEGEGTVEAFREAFVAAAERVQILAPGRQRSTVTPPAHIARPWFRRK